MHEIPTMVAECHLFRNAEEIRIVLILRRILQEGRTIC
jgi:hypothetical protein